MENIHPFSEASPSLSQGKSWWRTDRFRSPQSSFEVGYFFRDRPMSWTGTTRRGTKAFCLESQLLKFQYFSHHLTTCLLICNDSAWFMCSCRALGSKSDHSSCSWIFLSWNRPVALLHRCPRLPPLLPEEPHRTLQFQRQTQGGELHLPCL